MGRLDEKVIIVTGANSGVGAATAKRLANEGAKVVIAARRVESLKAVEEEIKANGGTVLAVSTDISKDEDCIALAKAAVDTFGKLDVLVNNAGVLDTGLKAIDKYSDEDWDRVFSINTKGTMQMTRAALKYMTTGGSVVCTVSNSAVCGGGGAVYTASKGAILTMVKHGALRYQNAQIRFNAICPGSIATPMIADMAPEKLDQDIFGAMAQHSNLMSPICMPDDVANVILFFASDESKCITGQVLVTDFGSIL